MADKTERIPLISRFLHDMKAALLLWPYFRDLKPLLFLSVLLGLISSAIESVAVGLIMLFLVKTVRSDVAMPDNPVIASLLSFVERVTGNDLIWIWGLIIGIILLKSVIIGSYHYLAAYLMNHIHHKLSEALFYKYMMLNYRDMARMDYGAMAHTLQIESWYAVEVVKALSGILISLCATFVYIGVIFFLFSAELALMGIALAVVMKPVLSLLKQPLREKGVEATRVHEELSSRMLTRMQGLKTIRAHGLEDREKKTFSALSKNVAKVFTRISVVDLYLRPANDICIILCIAALIWYSSYIGNPVTITATVIALLYKLRPYILGIESALTVIIRSQGPLKAILKQLSIPGLRPDPEDAVPPPQNWKTLRFDRVSFGYDENALILKDLSFVLNRNETVVIRGVSGAGKSTLINLILKLVDPASGTITIDERPFDKIARIPWLSRLAAAGQDFDLLDGTLRENLTFGRNISDEMIFEALRIAEIYEFVENLPEGLDTKIGDRGLRLSGGQRQRIILARALSGHPQLLIMDEATSAVSFDVEAKIHRNIRTYCPDMTIILITHRPLADDFGIEEIWVNNSPPLSAKQAAVS